MCVILHLALRSTLDLYGEHKVQKLKETRDKQKSEVKQAYVQTYIYISKNTRPIRVRIVKGLAKDRESERGTESVE